MTAAPLVTLVTPVFNHARFLPDAIDSILAQDHRNWEMIIVDDHSTDASLEVARRHARRDPERIRVLENPAKGKVTAFNHGIAAGRGDWFHLFASDDRLLPSCLSTCLSAAAAAGASAVYHDVNLVDEDLRPIAPLGFEPTFMERSLDEIVHAGFGGVPPSGSWLFDRRLRDLAWPLDPGLPYEDLWLAMVFKCVGSVLHLAERLGEYRQHGAQTFGRLDDHSYPRFVFRLARQLQVMERLAQHEPVQRALSPAAAAELERQLERLRIITSRRGVSLLFSELGARDKLTLTAHQLLPERTIPMAMGVLRVARGAWRAVAQRAASWRSRPSAPRTRR